MNVLVLSRQHQLLPFANRLAREGCEVETIIYHAGKRGRYEAAYKGVLSPLVSHVNNKRIKVLNSLIEIAEEGNTIVVTNSTPACKEFNRAKYLYGVAGMGMFPPEGNIRFGAWFTGSEFVLPHVLLFDKGAWPGGLGAQIEAGVTMVGIGDAQQSWAQGLLTNWVDKLRDRGFKGLCQWEFDTSNGLALSATHGVFGWPRLHSHVFLDSVDLGSLLETGEPTGELPRYTVALHVSQPPWPAQAQAATPEVEISGVTDSVMERVFWHDVCVDQESRTVRTAGLDGWVGVVRGSGHCFEIAQAKAVDVANTLRFENKQYRPDVGLDVRRSLALLEERYGLNLG